MLLKNKHVKESEVILTTPLWYNDNCIMVVGDPCVVFHNILPLETINQKDNSIVKE